MTLPAGWRTSTLGEISLSQRNGIFAARPGDSPSGTPVLRISAVRDGQVDFSGARYVQGLSPNEIERYAVKPGDLLFTRYNGSRRLVGICGLVGEHDGPVVHPDKLIRVVVNPAQADSRFVNLQMEAPAARAHLEPRIRTTAGQSGISGVDLRTLPVVLPPLDEQRRIVELLEEHMSRLKAAENYLKGTLARAAVSWRSSLMSIPDVGQRGISLGKVAEAVRGVTYSRPDVGPARDPDHIGLLRATNFDDGQMAVDSDLVYVHKRCVKPVQYLRQGDVIVASSSGSLSVVGKSFLLDESGSAATFGAFCTVLRPKSGQVPSFLAYWIRRPDVRRAWSAAAGGTNINNLRPKDMLATQVPNLPVEQQVALSKLLRGQEEALRRLCEQLLSEVRRGQALRKALLAAAFSGRLCMNVANSEIADA